MEPLWKVVQIVRDSWVLVEKDKSNHAVADSLRGVLTRAGVEQLHQVKRMIGGIWNTFLSTFFSNLKMGKIQGFFRWTSGARDNPTWANFGKQNWR